MPCSPLDAIAFDADDTLWQNECFFRQAEDRLLDLLAEYGDRVTLSQRLLAIEKRNVGVYGFGIKGFTLSMLETALEVSDGRIAPSVVADILAMGREMLNHPVELLPSARATLEALSDRYPLLLITKGDLFDQERKLAKSGLAGLFARIEIVSEKTAETYAKLFTAAGSGPAAGMMIGNSLRSDILPALAAGAYALHVPHELTWAFEHVEEAVVHPRLFLGKDLSDVLQVIEQITRTGLSFGD